MTSTNENPPPLFSCSSHRLKIALLLNFGIAVCVCMRTNLNMAVVCMVNTTFHRTQLIDAQATHHADEICSRNDEGSIAKDYDASACFIYVVVTLATPFLAEFSFEALFAARLIMGIAEGFVMPSVGSMAGRWFPPLERSTLSGIYTSGSQLGAASSSLISVFLCSSPLRWPSIFYLFGTLGVIFIACWLALASNSPATNRFIYEREEKFLESQIQRKKRTKTIPWRSILTSKPIYACLLVHFAFNFSSTLMQTFLPTYFRDDLQIPLSTNGAYTMIPFVVQIFMRTACSMLADSLKRKGILDVTTCSKVFQTLCKVCTEDKTHKKHSQGTAGISASLIALSVLPSCHRPWIAAVCLACYGIFYSFGIPGFYTALMSLAPQYSGTLLSLTMLSATFANIASPSLVSLLMTLRSPHIWKIMFCFTAVLNIIGGCIFLIFGDAEVQEWAKSNGTSPSVVGHEENTTNA